VTRIGTPCRVRYALQSQSNLRDTGTWRSISASRPCSHRLPAAPTVRFRRKFAVDADRRVRGRVEEAEQAGIGAGRRRPDDAQAFVHEAGARQQIAVQVQKMARADCHEPLEQAVHRLVGRRRNFPAP